MLGDGLDEGGGAVFAGSVRRRFCTAEYSMASSASAAGGFGTRCPPRGLRPPLSASWTPMIVATASPSTRTIRVVPNPPTANARGWRWGGADRARRPAGAGLEAQPTGIRHHRAVVGTQHRRWVMHGRCHVLQPIARQGSRPHRRRLRLGRTLTAHRLEDGACISVAAAQ